MRRATVRLDWTFLAAIVAALLFGTNLQAQTRTKPIPKSERNKQGAQAQPQPKNFNDPRNEVINELYYKHTIKGFQHFNMFRFSSALPEFERATRDIDFIPLDVYDNNMHMEYYGEFEASMGLDVRGFYKGYALYCEGATLAVLGRLDDAKARFSAGETIAEIRYEEMPSFMRGNCLQGLAFVAGAKGNAQRAAILFRAAHDQYKFNEAQNGYQIPSHLNWISMGVAAAEIAHGRLDFAETALDLVEVRQEVERRLKIGPGDSAKATRLILLGHVRRLQGRDSEALELYSEALPLCRDFKIGGEKSSVDHPLTPFVLDGLGELALNGKRFEDADKNFRESLEIRERGQGKGHRDLAYSLDGLGRVAIAKGRTSDSYFDRAKAILTASLGPDHPDIRLIASHRSSATTGATLPEKSDRGKKTRPPANPARRFLTLPTLLFLDIEDTRQAPRNWPSIKKNIRAEHRAAAQRAKAPEPGNKTP